MSGRWWRWARPLGGAVVLTFVLAHVGAGALTEAVRRLDAGAFVLGAGLAVVSTATAAWRWRLVASRLEVSLRMPVALVACYRAQFLNLVLPGGVLGDVDRGVRHGREVQDIGRGVRAVAWERSSGQVVLVLLAVGAFVVARPFPGLPGGTAAVLVAVTAVAVTAVAVIPLAVGRARTGWLARRGRWARVLQHLVTDARALASLRTVAGLVASSVVVVAGHVATFVVAARAVGVTVPLSRLLPVVLLVLVGSAVPLNLAGWGPREGTAAWGFAAAGMGASQGLAVAVAYGAIVLVAALPGAALLLGRPSTGPTVPPEEASARA